MNTAIAGAVQLALFLAKHREDLASLVRTAEDLIDGGPAKAEAVRKSIGRLMGNEALVDAAWPFVEPIFNAAVARIKAGWAKLAAQATATPAPPAAPAAPAPAKT